MVASEIALLAKSASDVHKGIRDEVSQKSEHTRFDEQQSLAMRQLERNLSSTLDYLTSRQQKPLELKLSPESIDLFEKDYFSKKLDWLAQADRLTTATSPKMKEKIKVSSVSKVIPLRGSQRARTIEKGSAKVAHGVSDEPDWDDDRFEDF